METNESSYVPSPEVHGKRSTAPVKSLSSDPTEKPTYIRFLVSNPLAGAVIGKGGSTINDFQSQSGARIQLSRSHEFFPGTTDRIIMISGTIDEILRAVDLVIDKLLTELHAEDQADDVGTKTKLRLIVPNSSCGSIIGKAGATIKSFMDDSQAVIKISRLDHSYYGLNDRLVTLTGTLDEQMRALELILLKLSEDTLYSQTMTVPYTYAGVFFSGFHGMPYGAVPPPVPAVPHNTAAHYGPNMGGRKFQNNKDDRTNSLTIGVADEHIGFVVGRGGRNIMEISQISGARIKVSDRGDFFSGTSERKVTISGPQRSIRTAESMIMQKVAYASDRLMD